MTVWAQYRLCQTIGNEGEGFGGSPRDEGQSRNGLTRVAKILGIEQMKLEDAFTQAGGGIIDRALQQKPFDHEPGSQGAEGGTGY